MEKTREAHSLRPRVGKGPTSSATGPSAVVGPSAAVVGASPSMPAVRPSVAVASPTPSAVQSPTAGDVEGSSSVAPA